MRERPEMALWGTAILNVTPSTGFSVYWRTIAFYEGKAGNISRGITLSAKCVTEGHDI